LLVVASFGVAAATAVAAYLPHSELASFGRCVALLTLGSWWIQERLPNRCSFTIHTRLTHLNPQVGDLMFCRPSFDTNEGVAIAPTLFIFHVFAWSAALVGLLLLTPGRAARAEAIDREKAID
jgi:hypothetical protein